MPDELSLSSNGHSHPDPDLVQENDYSPPRGNPFGIVGIGASAGGLDAFAQLFSAIPENTGLAFVLVQHLDPQHPSLLPELLIPMTPMRVETVQDGVKILPDRVYVIPPNTSMELSDAHLHLSARPPGLHLPIDIFFRSLAEVQGSRAIGVVLSGNAADGSLGVRAIKAECGLTFAQDEASAKFRAMPHNAAATGAIDFILPPAEIGRELSRIGRHRFLVPQTPGVAETETLPEGDDYLAIVLSLLQTATRVDFTLYKPTTINRRIGRRMMVLRIESLAEYVRYLQQKPAEMAELYKDLLISVTSFFRDPGTFESVLKQLQPAIEERGQRDEPIRVWVPGCATGEEVYSLAICLSEHLQEREPPVAFQIFGTDISLSALERARVGVYGSIITEDVSEARLRRFFVKSDGSYQVSKMIRESCIFARHDVTRDPPFSRLDLLSCRNVLIYLDNRAQKRVLPTFHYALNAGGVLMLGSAETPSAAADLFTATDKAHHVYRRNSVPTRLLLNRIAGLGAADAPSGGPGGRVSSGADAQKSLDRILSSRYSPDAVVVNGEMQILQFRGHMAPYLDPGAGEASLNLLRLIKQGLALPVRRGVQKASETELTVRESGVTVDIDGHPEEVSIEVTSVAGGEPAEPSFLIVFVRRGSAQERTAPEPGSSDGEYLSSVQALERDLTETREYLRTIAEHYEAAGEELRAANEEARSANEELQSTNEELETTKEELQSANEELTTVNEELQSRNGELANTNSDLRNTLASVTASMIIVDQDLRVRRFNPASEKLLELGPRDIGRPVGYLRTRIETSRLEQQVRGVIETLSPVFDEVQDVSGVWYSVGIRPYRTMDDRISGAVITFQDINALKRALEASQEARQYAEALIETVRELLVVLDADFRVQRATDAYYTTFQVTREEMEGRSFFELGNGQWNSPRLRELLTGALGNSESFHDFEIQQDFPKIGRKTMRVNGRRIRQPDAHGRTILLAIENVTERREVATIRFRRLFETAKEGIVIIDPETATVEDVNPYLLQLTGYGREDFVGRNLTEAGALLGLANTSEIVEATSRSEIVRLDEIRVTNRTGSELVVDIVANRYAVGNQPVVQLNVRDVTGPRLAAAALAESEERYRLVIESVRDYAIFQLDRAGRVVSWNPGAARILGWTENEIVGQDGSAIFTPEDRAKGEDRKEIETARKEGRADDQRWHLRKDGTRFFASGVLTQTLGSHGEFLGFTKIMQDITARKEQEDRLKRSLDEKSILLREVHHRVKNNLQMIVSLLNLQSRHADNPQVMAAFEETQSRIRAVAQIHEHLYGSEDLSEIEIGGYLASLASELSVLHATERGPVKVQAKTSPLFLPIDLAIPVALIANELILNSLKHGVRDGTGVIGLTFLPDFLADADGDNTSIELSVEDSGPGFPPGFNGADARSMGLRLIYLLARQLRGEVTMSNVPGAKVTVKFGIRRKFRMEDGQEQM